MILNSEQPPSREDREDQAGKENKAAGPVLNRVAKYAREHWPGLAVVGGGLASVPYLCRVLQQAFDVGERVVGPLAQEAKQAENLSDVLEIIVHEGPARFTQEVALKFFIMMMEAYNMFMQNLQSGLSEMAAGPGRVPDAITSFIGFGGERGLAEFLTRAVNGAITETALADFIALLMGGMKMMEGALPPESMGRLDQIAYWLGPDLFQTVISLVQQAGHNLG